MSKLFKYDNFLKYLTDDSSEINGYLQSGSAALIWSIFEIQDELEISGNIAEIGVYHGKLFIYLCLTLNRGERAFAFDLFESQPNIQGIRTEEDMQKFNAINLEFNLAKFGLGNDNVTIITANTQDLEPKDLLYHLESKKVRIFSVDGDHSRRGVRHDLNLAAAATDESGVIIVDDLFNSLCPSNTEGIIDFFSTDNQNWEPIAIAASNGPIKTGAAKLFVAHKSHAIKYKAYLRLLNREDYKISDTFLGQENVMIFDFQSKPKKYRIDDTVRQSVANFLKEIV